jgi:hypothetical protein
MSTEDYLHVHESEFIIPHEIASWRPPVGVLSEKGVELVSDVTNWFDKVPLMEIAREGIDLEADIPPGAVPPAGVSLWRAKDQEEEKYMKEIIIGKGLKEGHLRMARKEEVRMVNIFPTFLLFKRPGKYRDVINFKSVLDLSRWKRKNVSFNDATPLHRRPSVSPGRIREAFHILERMVKEGVDRNAIRVAKLDIAEAYKHIMISKSVQRQQSFKVGGQVYISLRMQFGTAASASIWCRLMNMVEQTFHMLGLGTITYFDDILLISISAGSAVRGLRLVRSILKCLGLKVNEEKSDAHGSRHCEFLGIEIDLDTWSARVMSKSIDKIRKRCMDLRALCRRERSSNEEEEEEGDEIEEREGEEAMAFLTDTVDEIGLQGSECRGSVKVLAQKIAGGLNFSAGVIRCIKPVRSHFHWLARAGRIRNSTATLHYISMVERLLVTHNWTRIVHIPYELERQHDTELASDSSETMMGAVARDLEGNAFYISEVWHEIDSKYVGLHINDKELLAHIMAVQLLSQKVGKEYVVVESLVDNTVAGSWVNKLFAKLDDEGGEAQSTRLKWLVDYAGYQQNRGIVVTTRWIPSEENVIPDALSRMESHAHVFDAYAQSILSRGKACTRVRVPRSWEPEKA